MAKEILKLDISKIEDMSLEEIKQWLRDATIFNDEEHRANCPICNRIVKVYRRKLTKSLINKLIILYQQAEYRTNHFIDKEDIMNSVRKNNTKVGYDYSVLKYWDLIIQSKDIPQADGNPKDGFYAVSEIGELFLQGMIKRQRCQFTYNDEILTVRPDWAKDKDYDMIDINDIYDNFDYDVDVRGLI